MAWETRKAGNKYDAVLDPDWYESPTWCVTSALARLPIGGHILEPGCGSGVICKEILRLLPGSNIHAIDLLDHPDTYSLADRGVDFLEESENDSELAGLYDYSIMNPPFTLATEFIKRALRLTSKSVYMFQRTNFLEADRYEELFSWAPCEFVYVFCKRVQCFKRGQIDFENGGQIAFAWFVFNHGFVGEPKVRWITDRPTMKYDTRVGVAEALAKCSPIKVANLMKEPSMPLPFSAPVSVSMAAAG